MTKTITLTLDDDTAEAIGGALQEALDLMEPFHEDSDPEDKDNARIYSEWATAIAVVKQQIDVQVE